MIRALLVDDEEPARDRLRAMLGAFDDVRIVGEATDGEEAVAAIARSCPDLVFLDIQMPGMNGLHVAASLAPPRPHVIFCTAFDQYAIDAFEHHAVDYLLKPLRRERLGRAVERVRQTLGERARQRLEVEDATRTQARLLPQSLPATKHVDAGGVYRAAAGVGGDYYDFLPVDGSRFGIALGDVSGKGLPAGLLMASLQARVQALAARYGERVAEMLSELNGPMHASTESNRYASLFYAVYDDQRRRLTYANAGHQTPLLLRASGGTPRVERLEVGGTAIGMFPDARFEQACVSLASGDILLAFSDGVTEATGASEEEFGEERLVDSIERHAGSSAKRLCEQVVEDVDRFAGAAPQRDDLTLVAVRIL